MSNKPFNNKNVLIKKNNDKEKILYFAAAGLSFSVLIVMLFVINHQNDASAKDQVMSSSIVPNVGTVTLYVPERPIRVGQKLTEIPLKEAYWPRNQVPDGAIRDKEELKNLYAKVDLPAGMPLQRDHLTSQSMQATLPVTPGNRAVTIEVDATSGLEGLALPGTRVDVVLTYEESNELTSKIIVQNARILSSGGDTTTVAERGMFEKKSSSSGLTGDTMMAFKTVSLDVSTRDALKISTARQLGRLSLTMRAPEDSKISSEIEVNANEVGNNEGGKRIKSEKSFNTSCTKGHYRVNGKEFQLNCDGSRMMIENE
jgi:pilus assembly protein CpaB